jgi:hypothetical protein
MAGGGAHIIVWNCTLHNSIVIVCLVILATILGSAECMRSGRLHNRLHCLLIYAKKICHRLIVDASNLVYSFIYYLMYILIPYFLPYLYQHLWVNSSKPINESNESIRDR